MHISYKDILNRADDYCACVTKSQPQNLQCGRGCSLCCYGLFQIGAADIPVLAEGLANLHPMRRRKSDLNFNEASDQERVAAVWDLNWEDALDPEEEYTIPEAIVFIARVRGWM